MRADISRTPMARMSGSLAVPAVVGPLRPTVLVPVGFGDGLSDDAVRETFVHELAHIRRRDLACSYLDYMACALQWWNPVAWWALAQMRKTQEMACDGFVLRRMPAEHVSEYGETLLALLTQVRDRRRFPLALAVVERHQDLRRRMRHIAEYRPPGRIWPAFSLALVALLAATAFTEDAPPPLRIRVPVIEEPAAGTSDPVDVNAYETRYYKIRNETIVMPTVRDGKPGLNMVEKAFEESLDEANAPEAVCETSYIEFKENPNTVVVHTTEGVLRVFEAKLAEIDILPRQIAVVTKVLLGPSALIDRGTAALQEFWIDDPVKGYRAPDGSLNLKSEFKRIDRDKGTELLCAPRITVAEGSNNSHKVVLRCDAVRFNFALDSDMLAGGPITIDASGDPLSDVLPFTIRSGADTVDTENDSTVSSLSEWSTRRDIIADIYVEEGETQASGILVSPIVRKRGDGAWDVDFLFQARTRLTSNPELRAQAALSEQQFQATYTCDDGETVVFIYPASDDKSIAVYVTVQEARQVSWVSEAGTSSARD